MPEPEAAITISAAIGQQASYSVTWHNPFLSPVKADVRLASVSGALQTGGVEDVGRSSGFELLGRKQQSTAGVAPGASLQLSVAYTAHSMEESMAELRVTAHMDDSTAEPTHITWQYPLRVRSCQDKKGD